MALDTGEGITGNMDWRFLKGVSQNEGLHYAPTVPGVSFVMFQMMFAVITPLILTGAVAERMKFTSYVLFIVAWSALIYYPLVHWIWGDGWLFGNPGQLGAQAIGVGIAVLMGFGGTWLILKILKALVPIRVKPEVEEAGLDIEEHAEGHTLMKKSMENYKT